MDKKITAKHMPDTLILKRVDRGRESGYNFT
jgi:hypothetical protein